MCKKAPRSRVIVPADSPLYSQLELLASHHRMVFLPGTGKSLLIHQLTHLAAAGNRNVYLLQ